MVRINKERRDGDESSPRRIPAARRHGSGPPPLGKHCEDALTRHPLHQRLKAELEGAEKCQLAFWCPDLQIQMCSAVPKHQLMRTVSVFDTSARITSVISEAVDVCTEHNTGPTAAGREKISLGDNWPKTLQAAPKVGVQVQPTNPNGKPNPLTPNQTS